MPTFGCRTRRTTIFEPLLKYPAVQTFGCVCQQGKLRLKVWKGTKMLKPALAKSTLRFHILTTMAVAMPRFSRVVLRPLPSMSPREDCGVLSSKQARANTTYTRTSPPEKSIFGGHVRDFEVTTTSTLDPLRLKRYPEPAGTTPTNHMRIFLTGIEQAGQ